MDRTRLHFVEVVDRLWSAAVTSKGKSENCVEDSGCSSSIEYDHIADDWLCRSVEYKRRDSGFLEEQHV
jgi:hypothetical protein